MKGTIAVAAFAVLILVLGCGLASDQAPPNSEGSDDSQRRETVGVIQNIMDEYKQNPLRTKGKYVGTRQTMSGKVEEIGTDLSVPPFVYLTIDFGTSIRTTFARRLPLNWQSMPQWPGYEWLDDVNTGDRVTVECAITGFSGIFSADQEGRPRLEECEFLGTE